MTPPILFLLFNRPDVTRRSFQAIRSARPGKLFVAADGPRAHVASDELRCDQARRIIEQVDWECQVETRFLSCNRGCQFAVSDAISWFFEHVDQGIILEDDCVADTSFFRFSGQLLDLYADNERVGVVTGNNFQRGHQRGDASYYFSKYNHCWGWATWKRAWDRFDFSMSHHSLSDAEVIKQFSCVRGEDRYWRRIFRTVRKGEINSWAYRWTYSCWANRLLTAAPQNNLVENIGFGEDATHTTSNSSNLPCAGRLTFPLRHPEKIVQDSDADSYGAKKHFNVSNSLFVNGYRRIKSLFQT